MTVTIRYSLSSRLLSVPIFSVERLQESLAAVTVQIPFELKLPYMGMGPPRPDPDGVPLLIVSQRGVAGRPVRVVTVPDNIHILNVCDQIPGAGQVPEQPGFLYREEPPCTHEVVTHASGAQVSPGDPAKAGETVTAYGVGLGNTNTGAKTGDAAPSEASPTQLARLIRVCFQFSEGERGTEPNCAGSPSVGLAGGYVGLYRITFEIPALPRGARDCSVAGSFSGDNLTVTVAGTTSHDEAHLCVERDRHALSGPKRE